MKKLMFAALALTAQLQAYFFFSPETLEKNLTAYSAEEKEWIAKDLKVVKSVCFPEKPESKTRPRYLATAGSPGSRKTTTLERFLDTHPDYASCIYIDPDPRTLKYMVHTYVSRSLNPLTIAKVGDYNEVIKQGYEKWRLGSLYISGVLLEEALENHYDVAHGTTLTADFVPRLLQTIRDAGYEITLLLCSAEDNFRSDAIRYRNEVQRFYQCSPEDAVNKGKFFPQRMETYFTYADRLHFYWSDDLQTAERLAASWENGRLTIIDQEAWERFGQKYEGVRQALLNDGKEILAWADLVNRYAR